MALILLCDSFGGHDLREKGVEISACARVEIFKPFEVRADISPVQERRFIQRAQAVLVDGETLPLVRYEAHKHGKLVADHLKRTAMDTADVSRLALAKLLQRVKREDILGEGADVESLAEIAVALGRFPSVDSASMLSLPTLKEICLAGLGFTGKEATPGAPPATPPAAPAVEVSVRLDALCEKLSDHGQLSRKEIEPLDDRDLLTLLKRFDLVARQATMHSLGGREKLLEHAFKALGVKG